jgi:hypothetical protein
VVEIKSIKKYHVVMDKFIFLGDIPNIMKNPPHKKLSLYLDILRQDIGDALLKGETQESLAEKCSTSGETIGRILGGKRGKNLSVDIALKIWDGLGILQERLGQTLPPEFARKVKNLGQDEMDLLMKFVDLLSFKDAVPTVLMAALAGTITALHSEAIKHLFKGTGNHIEPIFNQKTKN